MAAEIPTQIKTHIHTHTHSLTLQFPIYIVFIVRTENYTISECKMFPVWPIRSQSRKRNV